MHKQYIPLNLLISIQARGSQRGTYTAGAYYRRMYFFGYR